MCAVVWCGVVRCVPTPRAESLLKVLIKDVGHLTLPATSCPSIGSIKKKVVAKFTRTGHPNIEQKLAGTVVRVVDDHTLVYNVDTAPLSRLLSEAAPLSKTGTIELELVPAAQAAADQTKAATTKAKAPAAAPVQAPTKPDPEAVTSKPMTHAVTARPKVGGRKKKATGKTFKPAGAAAAAAE